MHAQAVDAPDDAAKPGAGVASASTITHSATVATLAPSPRKLARAAGESEGPVSLGIP